MRKMLNLCLICVLLLSACSKPGYEKFSGEFFDVFDTVTIVTGYEKTREDFDRRLEIIHGEMLRLHKLYDIYNDYPGTNNIKTINDNAGIAPVEADKDLLELIELGKEAYHDTNGAVNIALGAVLSIWHEYRAQGIGSPESAAIPPITELEAAAEHTNINDIIIDKEAGTVFLKDSEMSLDLGAIAKGFAVGKAGEKAVESGMRSAIISAGGNVYTAGAPMDGRESWNVGIQNPFASEEGNQLIDTVQISDLSVVTSGDYQRFYVAGGERYHHIIDPKTLYPAQSFSAVTIAHEDSGTADILSTAAFILPYEEGKRLVEALGGEAIWFFADKSYEATEGYKKTSKLYGITP